MSQFPSVTVDTLRNVHVHEVAIVAPQWLQDGLAVVAKAIPHVRLVACTGSVSIFLLLDLPHEPDVIILTVDAPLTKASDQVRQTRFIYPNARYLVLLQEQSQADTVRAAGADATLLQGASAEQFAFETYRLLQAIESSRKSDFP